MNASVSQPNWLARNWKWLIPVGAASLLALFVAVIALFLAGLFGLIRRSEPYQHALAAAQSHPRLVAALGEPIAPGFAVMGRIETSNADGSANLNFAVLGPRGEARIYVVAEQTRGAWHYEVIEADAGSAGRFDLLAADAAATSAR